MASFKEIIEIRNRAHRTGIGCFHCPLYRGNTGIDITCFTFLSEHPGKAEKALLDWNEKHPIRTMRDDFFEKFPNAPRNNRGNPLPCPASLGYEEKNNCSSGYDCTACWGRPMKDTV